MTTAEDLDHTPAHWSKKYPGLTPSEIAKKDPRYLVWVYGAIDPKPCSEVLFKDCKADVDRGRQSLRVGRDQDLS